MFFNALITARTIKWYSWDHKLRRPKYSSIPEKNRLVVLSYLKKSKREQENESFFCLTVCHGN